MKRGLIPAGRKLFLVDRKNHAFLRGDSEWTAKQRRHVLGVAVVTPLVALAALTAWFQPPPAPNPGLVHWRWSGLLVPLGCALTAACLLVYNVTGYLKERHLQRHGRLIEGRVCSVQHDHRGDTSSIAVTIAFESPTGKTIQKTIERFGDPTTSRDAPRFADCWEYWPMPADVVAQEYMVVVLYAADDTFVVL